MPRTPGFVADCAWRACVLEATAQKPGNVSPGRSFDDMTYEDLVASARVARPELEHAGTRGVGATVLAMVAARRRVAAANTNLGIALLFAPLARAALQPAAPEGPLRERLADVLRRLDVDDARAAFEAIAMAGAGGLGERADHDVRSAPRIGLREAMALAAGQDSIASEYATGYAIVFDRGLPALLQALHDGLGALDAIVELHLTLLAQLPDTLIARRCGSEAARAVSDEAAAVLDAGGVRTDAGRAALTAFDASLRGERNQLNPGTTADLVAATLFVALLENADASALSDARVAGLLP